MKHNSDFYHDDGHLCLLFIFPTSWIHMANYASQPTLLAMKNQYTSSTSHHSAASAKLKQA